MLRGDVCDFHRTMDNDRACFFTQRSFLNTSS